MFNIKDKMAKTAKRAGLLTAGSLCCITGAGFLTVSGWLALVPLVGTTTTALILAGVYLGVGLILIAVGSGDAPAPNQQPTEVKKPQTSSDAPPIMQAFMFGMQAGANADKGRR